MSAARWMVLTLGPVVLTGASWWLTSPDSLASLGRSGTVPPGGSQAETGFGLSADDDAGAGARLSEQLAPPDSAPGAWSEDAVHERGLLSGDNDSAEPDADRSPAILPINVACAVLAQRLEARFGGALTVLTRPPFVLAANLKRSELDAYHVQVIAPLHRALASRFFRTPPREPITIVLLADEAAFLEFARTHDGENAGGHYAYYLRSKRRIVANLETGDGTIAHELTHALAHADAPGLPEWFDEGLAALHEDCRFDDGRQQLVGLPNWRCRLLAAAAERGSLPALEKILADREWRSDGLGVKYACVRSLCLFLQEHGWLAAYYDAVRGRPADDPAGIRCLLDITGCRTLDDLSARWAAWRAEQFPNR